MIDWDKLVAEHGPKVWRTVYRLLADHAEALDCYQDTFLALRRSPPQRPVVNWEAFLTALAARRAIDRLRQRKRQRTLLAALEHAPPPASRSADPADELAAAELLDRVRGALAELPDRQAEVFWLSCVDGLPHAEIAAQLRVSSGAVRAILHRARTALSAALNPLSVERSES